MYLSRIKAQFPTAGADTLIPLAWIERAQERWRDFTDQLRDGRASLDGQDKVLGVDVARFGADSTVRSLKVGEYVAWQRVSSQEDTMQTTGRVAADLREDSTLHAQIDVIGLGAGVADRLRELFPERTHDINVAERASEPDRFANQRAEFYWELRTLFEQGGIMIPPDEELEEELSHLTYKVVDSSGKIRIAEKEEMRKDKELGRSPDRADSLMLTVAKPAEQQEAFVVFGD